MVMTRTRKFHQKLSKSFSESWGQAFPASILLVVCGSTGPSFLIQDVGDSQEVLGRPDVDVDFFCCPGIGMAEDGTNKLNRDAFFIQGRGEIVAQGVRSEPGYPGVPGEFLTEMV